MSQTKNALKRMMCLSLLASLGFVVLLSLAQTDAALAAGTYPPTGDWESFGVLGGVSVTNTGNTIITGNLGVSPGNTITGFPPGIVSPPGTTHAADVLAGSAQTSLTAAYNDLAGQSCDFGPFGPTDLAGQSLVPGVYCYSSTVQNSGTLTLNGTSATDIWVFKVGSALTTGPGSSVVFTGGSTASPCNVFWQVGSSATLDTTTIFIGNILALQSISLNNAATMSGRALARNGSVTLINNTINTIGCSGVPPPSNIGLFKVFSPSTINAGGVSTLTITFTNASTTIATLQADFTDNLPSGVTTVGSPDTTCGVTLPTATPTSVTLPSGATIPAGDGTIPGFCTVTIDVTAPAGSYVNTVPAGALYTDQGRNAASPGVVLKALAATATPTLSEWGMIIFMVLAGLMSIYYLKRKRAIA